MSNRKKRMISGAIGGMVGGAAVALAITVVQQVDWSHVPLVSGLNNQGQMSLMNTSSQAPQSPGMVGKRIMASALLGGIYGGLRAGLNLPGLLFGPLFGIASYPLSWTGLGLAAQRAPGPWKKSGQGMVPRLITHSFYGVVTDQVSSRVQDALS